MFTRDQLFLFFVKTIVYRVSKNSVWDNRVDGHERCWEENASYGMGEQQMEGREQHLLFTSHEFSIMSSVVYTRESLFPGPKTLIKKSEGNKIILLFPVLTEWIMRPSRTGKTVRKETFAACYSFKREIPFIYYYTTIYTYMRILCRYTLTAKLKTRIQNTGIGTEMVWKYWDGIGPSKLKWKHHKN